MSGDRHTELYTYYTEPGESRSLHVASDWVTVQLQLETAGPVAVGTTPDIVPVTAGRGRLLRTGATLSIPLVKGDRLYIASSSVNRVSVVIQPVPVLPDIANHINALAHKGGM